MLASYYLDLEQSSAAQGKDIAIYTPFRYAIANYLDGNKFMKCYRDIQEKEALAQGEEKRKIGILLTAWSYSYLQVCYHQGFSGTHFIPDGSHTFKFDAALEQALLRLGTFLQLFPFFTVNGKIPFRFLILTQFGILLKSSKP